MMRVLGWYGFLLSTLLFAGCGPASSLEEGVPEATEYVPAPKIEFPKRKGATAHSAPKSAPSTATTEAKK